MKMPKRNNKKRAPIKTARPLKITPKMKKAAKKLMSKNKRNVMTPMKKGY